MIHFRLTNVEFELTDSISHKSGKDTRPDLTGRSLLKRPRMISVDV